jgi:6,7-dimethyl-8-ribityllumazine synthase
VLKKEKLLDGAGVQRLYASQLLRGDAHGKGRKIGIVVSRWNSEITYALYDAAVKTLLDAGVVKEDILSVEVPGAFEIPLALRAFASCGNMDGLVALGCVIKGETAHFEYISDAVMSGIREVSLEYGMPIGCGILTTMNLAQAEARAGSDANNKGIEAALTTLEMISLLKKLASVDTFDPSIYDTLDLE